MAKDKDEANDTTGGLADLQKSVQAMQERRQGMVDGIADIDRSLEEVRATIDTMLGNSVLSKSAAPSKPSKTAVNRRKGRGTAIIEEILREHKGVMPSSECAALAVKRGVKYPHSSFQSLKKRGRIELVDHNIQFTDVK